MPFVLVTAPTADPVTVAEAKKFLRIDHELDDTEITSFITDATNQAEDFTGWAYMQQTWDLYLDGWPDKDFIEIRKTPVQSITSIKYTDSDGVEHTFSSSDYELDNKSFIPKVVLKYGLSWPSEVLKTVNAIQIRFVAGYAVKGADPAGNVPEVKKTAIKMLVLDIYEGKEYPPGYMPHWQRILWPDRIVPL
jgi:uncharacterized phiE125 gp8 family phage protein